MTILKIEIHGGGREYTSFRKAFVGEGALALPQFGHVRDRAHFPHANPSN